MAYPRRWEIHRSPLSRLRRHAAGAGNWEFLVELCCGARISLGKLWSTINHQPPTINHHHLSAFYQHESTIMNYHQPPYAIMNNPQPLAIFNDQPSTTTNQDQPPLQPSPAAPSQEPPDLQRPPQAIVSLRDVAAMLNQTCQKSKRAEVHRATKMGWKMKHK